MNIEAYAYRTTLKAFDTCDELTTREVATFTGLPLAAARVACTDLAREGYLANRGVCEDDKDTVVVENWGRASGPVHAAPPHGEGNMDSTKVRTEVARFSHRFNQEFTELVEARNTLELAQEQWLAAGLQTEADMPLAELRRYREALRQALEDAQEVFLAAGLPAPPMWGPRRIYEDVFDGIDRALLREKVSVVVQARLDIERDLDGEVPFREIITDEVAQRIADDLGEHFILKEASTEEDEIADALARERAQQAV